MASTAELLNRLVNPGVIIPGAGKRTEEEAARQLALQAAEKAKFAPKLAGVSAAAGPATSTSADVTPPAPAPTPAATTPPPFRPSPGSDTTMRGVITAPQPATPEPAVASSRQAAPAVASTVLPRTTPAPVVDVTQIKSPFTNAAGDAPAPGSWDALWGAKWAAARAKEQNAAVAAAMGAGAQALGAESSALRATNEPALAAAAQEAEAARSKERSTTMRDISAAEVGQRREAATQTAEQLKRQVISIPMGQRIDTSSGIPTPVNEYAHFVQDESGKMKRITLDPVSGVAAAAPPAGAVQLLKKNPTLAADFDKKYGQGAAARAMGQ